MSASIEIPFAIGEEVWKAAPAQHPRIETCPECAGTRALTLIKGNGESISIDCNYCALGYHPPRGYVDVRQTLWTPQRFVCQRFLEFYNGVAQYADDAGRVSAHDLFRDANACQRRCAEENAAQKEADAERAIACLASKRRDLAFSSHYWSRKVKDLERDLEAARARLAVCKKPRAAPTPEQTP